jgi:hypothetical protein
MKIAKKIFLSLNLAVIIFLGLANLYLQPASAQGLWNKQNMLKNDIANAFGENANDPTDVRQVMVYIIKVFLTFIGIIVITYIIIAGYKWMTAAGNDDKIREAKKQITNAMIGLIIILLSYAIVQFTAACLLDIIEGEGTWMCNFPHG